MRSFDLFHAEAEYDETDPDGYRAGMARFGETIGASLLGGSVYELPPGQSNCPYHYEHGDEEWLVVLAGRVTVRHPAGEDELGPGTVVCFPIGADGAHKLTNRTEETVRVLMLSTKTTPAVAIYPDSGKVGVFTDDPRDDRILFRRETVVDYWDGEA